MSVIGWFVSQFFLASAAAFAEQTFSLLAMIFPTVHDCIEITHSQRFCSSDGQRVNWLFDWSTVRRWFPLVVLLFSSRPRKTIAAMVADETWERKLSSMPRRSDESSYPDSRLEPTPSSEEGKSSHRNKSSSNFCLDSGPNPSGVHTGVPVSDWV